MSSLICGQLASIPGPSGSRSAWAPFLRVERVQRGIYEKAIFDIDVNALLQGFLRGARQHGTDIITGCGVIGIARCPEGWNVRAGGRVFKASTVINAAGAWADQLGVLAHATRIGLVPRRRTAISIDAPANLRLDSLPALDFAGTDNYIKPDAGQLMVSPGDAVAVDPQDIQPDELDVAVLVDWLERETTIQVTRPCRRWAGSLKRIQLPVLQGMANISSRGICAGATLSGSVTMMSAMKAHQRCTISVSGSVSSVLSGDLNSVANR